jgi:hypothetical protein
MIYFLDTERANPVRNDPILVLFYPIGGQLALNVRIHAIAGNYWQPILPYIEHTRIMRHNWTLQTVHTNRTNRDNRPAQIA